MLAIAMKFCSAFILVSAAILSLALLSQAKNDGTNFTNANASVRVEQTLKGLFQYYWRSDPARKAIQFFFVCGQIGGGGSQELQSCSCINPKACVYCYRWWDAVALESIATYGIRTNTKNYSTIANTIYAHSPYNANWNATAACTFIDDFSWYGIAYLRVYEWLKVIN